MRKTEVLAPAKINLFLEVLPRPAGAPLHPVETVIEKVTLFDRLSLQTAPSGIELRSNVPELDNPDNLAFRAAALLKETFHIKEGVRIRLEKRIPTAAGLGGGSSDAAAVLLALNRLWKIGQPARRLAPLALRLGSDVPAFLVPGRCLVSGFGEKVKPLPGGRKITYLLDLSGIKMATSLAYRWLDDLTYRPRSSKMMVAAIKKGDAKAVMAALFNRFQEVIEGKRAEIKERKLLLETSFGSCLLAGSGGAFFMMLTPGTVSANLQQNGGTEFSAVTTFGLGRQHGDHGN